MSSTALAVDSGATPAVRSSSTRVAKPGCDGVRGRRLHAVVRGDTHDVDRVDATLPQPVGQRCAVVVGAFEAAVGGRVLALAEHRLDGAGVELRVEVDARGPTTQCRGHDSA